MEQQRQAAAVAGDLCLFLGMRSGGSFAELVSNVSNSRGSFFKADDVLDLLDGSLLLPCRNSNAHLILQLDFILQVWSKNVSESLAELDFLTACNPKHELWSIKHHYNCRPQVEPSNLLSHIDIKVPVGP